MELNITTHADYIPEWNNNKEDLTPIKIEYKRITGELSGKLLVINSDQSGTFNYSLIIQKCITKIENLKINGLKIYEPQQLLDSVCTQGLIVEIANHIIADSNIESILEKKNQNNCSLEQ